MSRTIKGLRFSLDFNVLYLTSANNTTLMKIYRILKLKSKIQKSEIDSCVHRVNHVKRKLTNMDTQPARIDPEANLHAVTGSEKPLPQKGGRSFFLSFEK